MLRSALTLGSRATVPAIRRAAPGLSTGAGRALPTIEEVRRFAPSELEDARLRLAAALNEAVDDLSASYTVEKARHRTGLARLLGATLIRLGSPLDAESVLNAALNLDVAHGTMARRIATSNPDGPHGATKEELLEMSFMLGVCYQKSGREEEALAAFEDVLKRTGGAHWRARFHMALLSISNGWHEQGEELVRGVLEANPTHVESRAILAMLEERRAAVDNKLEPPDPDDKLK